MSDTLTAVEWTLLERSYDDPFGELRPLDAVALKQEPEPAHGAMVSDEAYQAGAAMLKDLADRGLLTLAEGRGSMRYVLTPVGTGALLDFRGTNGRHMVNQEFQVALRHEARRLDIPALHPIAAAGREMPVAVSKGGLVVTSADLEHDPAVVEFIREKPRPDATLGWAQVEVCGSGGFWHKPGWESPFWDWRRKGRCPEGYVWTTKRGYGGWEWWLTQPGWGHHRTVEVFNGDTAHPVVRLKRWVPHLFWVLMVSRLTLLRAVLREEPGYALRPMPANSGVEFYLDPWA